MGPAHYTLTGRVWLPDPDPDPTGPATVFFLPTVDAARYGGAAVGDVRGRVARFLSCRLRFRWFRVSGLLHAPHCSSWRQSWPWCGRRAIGWWFPIAHVAVLETWAGRPLCPAARGRRMPLSRIASSLVLQLDGFDI